MACRKVTFLSLALLLLAAIALCAPAEKAAVPVPANPEAAGSKQDLAVEDKDDLKPAASHWGGLGYGGYGGYGGWGHYGGYYPYYSSWGYPSYGYGGYGYGWPYGGYGYGFGHGGYGWW